MQQVKELPACPVETTLMLIGDKWKVLILRDLMPGTSGSENSKSPSAAFPRKFSPPSCGIWKKKGWLAAKYMPKFRRGWSTA